MKGKNPKNQRKKKKKKAQGKKKNKQHNNRIKHTTSQIFHFSCEQICSFSDDFEVC